MLAIHAWLTSTSPVRALIEVSPNSRVTRLLFCGGRKKLSMASTTKLEQRFVPPRIPRHEYNLNYGDEVLVALTVVLSRLHRKLSILCRRKSSILCDHVYVFYPAIQHIKERVAFHPHAFYQRFSP